MLPALVLIPVAAGLASRLLRRPQWVEIASTLGGLLTAVVAASVVADVARNGPQRGLRGLLYVDALSATLIAVIAIIGLAAALASIPYLRADLAARHVPDGRRGLGWYYLGLHAFIASMLATVCVNNLGLLWVGIEATTLASALLVGFYRTRAALEAAWKYLILCTVGITLALFGVLLTYYAAIQSGGQKASRLDWTSLASSSATLDPSMMRLAFVFIVVGFGTKAGFAPMHAWLADAHSQAPSPVSAVLSSILLPCALYGILRFHVVTSGATGTAFSSNLLLAFGVASMLIAVPFILVQRDVKRMLAYSSVEHVGLMSIAFGIGGPLGLYAGLLHLVNHAATKALLFFLAGDLGQRFGTRRISAIRGVLHAAPFVGWGFVLGALAITGAPPFSVFISELSIAGAGFTGGRLDMAAAIAAVLLLGVVFAGILNHVVRMAYGTARGDKIHVVTGIPRRRRHSFPYAVAIAPLAIIILMFGVYVPEDVSRLLNDAVVILTPPHGVAVK